MPFRFRFSSREHATAKVFPAGVRLTLPQDLRLVTVAAIGGCCNVDGGPLNPRCLTRFAQAFAQASNSSISTVKQLSVAFFCVPRGHDSASVEQIRKGVLYRAKKACLQRAVLLTFVLRRRGVPAELVIGLRTFPLIGHAWVEVEGRALMEAGTIRTLLQVAERC